jgi:hypothetical protein
LGHYEGDIVHGGHGFVAGVESLVGDGGWLRGWVAGVGFGFLDYGYEDVDVSFIGFAVFAFDCYVSRMFSSSFASICR